MLLAELAAASTAVAATRARSAKVALLADALRSAEAGEVAVAVTYLSGELRQRRTGVGYASLRDLPPPASDPTLSVTEVDTTFAAIAEVAGKGSAGERRRLVTELMAQATADEQRYLIGLVGGELRQGALESLVVDAVAAAAALPAADVRRAVMLRGALAPVAESALTEGAAGLAEFRLEVGRAVQPMLAQSADSVAAALERVSPAAVEWKLDGVRVQVHRDGEDVAIFTRSLDEVTDRLPEVVAAVRALPVRSIVLDGEVLALRPDGRPRRFQETGSRFASRSDPVKLRETTPLTTYVFDCLSLDGEDLLGLSAAERFERSSAVLPAELRVPRIVTADPAEAQAFFDDTVQHGHEGVVVKSLDAPYDAGRRGAGWVKVKPRHTLDLVVLAAEWGHGRRRGWLSNLHLGALDESTGGFVMLGKTFKGLTDELLTWQTEQLLARAVDRDDGVVHVRPELVVEIAFDGVQTSTRYPGGVALRFARVLRYRPDKRPADADTIEAVRAIYHG